MEMKQPFAAAYRNLELYLKHIHVQPNTVYELSMDTLGGEMEVFFSGYGVAAGQGVHYLPPAEVWQRVTVSFTTADEVSPKFESWGICFVKTAWPYHAYGGTYCATYVDNVRLCRAGVCENLLDGGEFEASSDDPVYDRAWRAEVLGAVGARLGVGIVPDPLRADNRCLYFPETVREITYPTPMPLMVRDCGSFYGIEREIQCIAFDGRPVPRFVLAEQGTVTVELNGQRYGVTDGQLLLLPADTPYRYTYHAGERTAYHWISVTGEQLAPLLERLSLTEPRVLAPASAYTLMRYAQELPTLSPDTVTYPLAVCGLLQLWFAELERQCVPATAARWHRQRIENSAKRLRARPELTVSNAELARECGLSETHYMRLFKQYLGTSPQHYRQAVLHRRACELLRDSRQSVQEIAYALGFDDPLYFSRWFRATQGVSPREYRRGMCSADAER